MKFKLRPWEMDDLASVAKYGCNPKIAKFMSDKFPDSVEKWKNFLEFATTDKKIFYLAIEIDGKAVGGIGIGLPREKSVEMGYWLGEEFWGKGIITEAIKEIVKISFENLGLKKIYAKPYETNHASHKVLQKAGFTLEKINEKAVVKNGESLDEYIFSIQRN